MSGSQQSVGKFCSITTPSLASLAQIDAVNLGNGAQCLVVASNRSYRFFFGSGLGTRSPVLIHSADGSGTWIQEDAVGDQSYFIEQSVNTSSFSSTLDTWHALPGGTGRYAEDSPRACWSLNTTTGVVLYTGPTATFLIRGYLSMLLDDVQNTYELDVSPNGTLIGGTGTFTTSTRCGSIDNSGALFVTHLSRPLLTTSGTTYQHMLRDVTASSTYQMLKYQASFTLLP